MDFRFADTFTDSLSRLTGEAEKAVKTTGFWGRKGGGTNISEIVDDLEAALEQFRLIASDLGDKPLEVLR